MKQIRSGKYTASTTSGTTVFVVGDDVITAKTNDDIFVKGINCKDVVTVEYDKLSSELLGSLTVISVVKEQRKFQIGDTVGVAKNSIDLFGVEHTWRGVVVECDEGPTIRVRPNIGFTEWKHESHFYDPTTSNTKIETMNDQLLTDIGMLAELLKCDANFEEMSAALTTLIQERNEFQKRLENLETKISISGWASVG